jgi:hypothetical protein
MTALAVEPLPVEPDPIVITAPGIYDIPNDVYHADPVPGGSLSSTGARRLLPPSCPALFRYEQLHGQPPKRVFDFGTAAHGIVLGSGPELVRVDAPNYLTKKAQAARDDARTRGAVPLLPHEYEQVQAMAEAIRQHPAARALFAEASGQPEQSLFWQDQRTGVWRRARLDWMPFATGRRMVVPDYKTAVSAAPSAIAKAVHSFGYHQQAAWYLDGVKALGGGDAAFVFVVQEKTPPYLVTVVELDPLALRIGRERNRQAIDLYRRCLTANDWPAYSDSIESISLPAWAENQHLQETEQ